MAAIQERERRSGDGLGRRCNVVGGEQLVVAPGDVVTEGDPLVVIKES